MNKLSKDIRAVRIGNSVVSVTVGCKPSTLTKAEAIQLRDALTSALLPGFCIQRPGYTGAAYAAVTITTLGEAKRRKLSFLNGEVICSTAYSDDTLCVFYLSLTGAIQGWDILNDLSDLKVV